MSTQDKPNSAGFIPGYGGYNRLFVTEYVTGRKYNDNKYNDYPSPWDVSSQSSEHSSIQSSQQRANTAPSSVNKSIAHSETSIPVNRLWRSIYTSSCANSTLCNMNPSSDQNVKQRQPSLQDLPLSYNLFRSTNPITGYERDMGRDPKSGPLKRTLGEPTIVQMSSTAPLFAATAKSNVDQRHIAGYSGHVPNREKAAAEPRPRAWFYDVSTANL